MQAVHVLVDLENNQPTLEDVKRLVPDVTHAWLFYSPGQAKRLASFEPLGDRCTAVRISRPGKNALDFHLTFYVGYLAARNPDAKLVVVAIDRGYGPMIEHAVDLDLKVAQVAFKPVAKRVRKVAAKRASAVTAPATRAPAAKKAAKKTPAKKTAATSSAPKQAAAKPPAAKKVNAAKQVVPPAKKLVATKTPRVTKAPIKGVRVTKPVSTKAVPKAVPAKVAAPTPSAKSPARGEPLSVEQVIANLKKVAARRRPKKLKQLRGHLSSLLRTGAADDKVSSLLANLLAADVLRLSGDTVVYGRAITGSAD